MKKSVKHLTMAAVVAALYASLTLLLAPLSYGAFQLRFAEVLCILPFFFPESVLGLTVGCLLADLFSAFGVLDIGIGTLATLLAALLTLLCGRLGRERFLPKLLACLSPILLNGILVGGVIAWVTAPPGAFASAWLTSGLWVAAGETAILLPVGLPLLLTLPRRAFFKKWLENYQSDDSHKNLQKG